MADYTISEISVDSLRGLHHFGLDACVSHKEYLSILLFLQGLTTWELQSLKQKIGKKNIELEKENSWGTVILTMRNVQYHITISESSLETVPSETIRVW